MIGNERVLTAQSHAQIAGCETKEDMINIAAMFEALAVTLFGVVLDNADNGDLDLEETERLVVQAMRAEDQAHYDFLVEAGAEALIHVFTLPADEIVTDRAVFFTTLVSLEEIFVAAYMTAAQQFAIDGDVDWVQSVLQIGAIQAEHRALARVFARQQELIDDAPNNFAFAPARFTGFGPAAKALTDLGFIGGDGPTLTYPGPVDIDTVGIELLRP